MKEKFLLTIVELNCVPIICKNLSRKTYLCRSMGPLSIVELIFNRLRPISSQNFRFVSCRLSRQVRHEPNRLSLQKSEGNGRHIYKSVLSLWRKSLGNYTNLQRISSSCMRKATTSPISNKPRRKSSEKTFVTPCKIRRESLRIVQEVTKVFSEDFFILSLLSSIQPKLSVPRNPTCFPHTTGRDSLKICSFVDNCRGTPVQGEKAKTSTIFELHKVSWNHLKWPKIVWNYPEVT